MNPHHRLTLALLATALALPVGAQTHREQRPLYRCGSSWSDRPCGADAAASAVGYDQPSEADRRAAEARARAERLEADRLAAARQARERPPRPSRPHAAKAPPPAAAASAPHHGGKRHRTAPADERVRVARGTAPARP